MSGIKTLIGVLIFVGCIALVITLAIVLSRDRNDCGLTSSELRITDFTFTETAGGVTVTWRRPSELKECNPLYEVTYNSTRGTFTNTVELESILVPDNTFCFEFNIHIRPLASTSNTAGGRTSYYDVRQLDVDFVVSIINPSEVTVSWTHPNQEWCSLQFMVKYQTDSETQLVNLTRFDAKFEFEYCMQSSVTIWPIHPNNGNLLAQQSATTVDATQYPSTLDGTYKNVTAYDDRLEMIWSINSPSVRCEFTYRAVFTTDMGIHTMYPDEPNIILWRNLFCFRVDTLIHALVGGNAIEISNTGLRYGMPNVTEIDVTASIEEGSLTATWASNPLEEQCNIIYEAIFESEIHYNRYRVYQPTATTELFYCVNTTVSVKAIHGDIVGTPEGVVFLEDYPSSLAPIDDIYINITDTAIVVSWEPPTSVEGCMEIYTVSAISNATDDRIECLGTMSCDLELLYPCSYIDFTIGPTPPIVGEERTIRYNCTENDLF